MLICPRCSVPPDSESAPSGNTETPTMFSSALVASCVEPARLLSQAHTPIAWSLSAGEAIFWALGHMASGYAVTSPKALPPTMTDVRTLSTDSAPAHIGILIHLQLCRLAWPQSSETQLSEYVQGHRPMCLSPVSWPWHPD